jgi:hypothetical protein
MEEEREGGGDRKGKCEEGGVERVKSTVLAFAERQRKFFWLLEGSRALTANSRAVWCVNCGRGAKVREA